MLGIVFGFTIAAVTAMSGTNFLRFQSKVVDTNTKGVQMTNAQRLKEYFEFSCTIGLFSILLMVIFGIVPEGWLRLNIVCPLTYGLLFLNLCSSYFVLKLVLKYFAESVD